jgi:hypothetical protein
VRRAGGDDDLAPRQGLRTAIEQPFDGRDDLERLGHAAVASLMAFRHLAPGGPDEGNPITLQGRSVAAGRRMRPHSRVHRRRHQHRLVGGDEHRRSEVVGMAVGELGHQIGGGRSDHQQIGLARKPDVADVVLVIAVEQFGEHMIGRKRADRQGGDEFPRGGSHDHAHRGVALAQPADEIQRLVGGDAAADDEQDGSAAGTESGGGAPAEKGAVTANRRETAGAKITRLYTRNGAAFGARSAEDYAARMKAFADNPPAGADTARRPNGDTLYYEASTNTFAVVARDGTPRTMFKPDDGPTYWAQQKARAPDFGTRRTAAQE